MTIRVLLLTRESCHYCEHAEQVLGRLGRDFPLEVSELEIDSGPGQKLAMEGGLLFPPGIVIEGRPFSYGRPSEGKLRREFERLSEGSAVSGRSPGRRWHR